jgi:hypothetical protein
VSRELDWKLWGLSWWVWIVSVGPEILLLSALAWEPALRTLERIGHRRNAEVILLGIISLDNAVALVALIGSLVSGHENSGGQLLLKDDHLGHERDHLRSLVLGASTAAAR